MHKKEAGPLRTTKTGQLFQVQGLIRGPAELEIGTFLAHTLLAAVEACNRLHSGSVTKPGTGTAERMLQLSGSIPNQFPTPQPPRGNYDQNSGQFQDSAPSYYSSRCQH